MAKIQHLYRRGTISWWRSVLYLSPGKRWDFRMSLRTASLPEARRRAAYLTSVAHDEASMYQNPFGDYDQLKTITAEDLKAIRKAIFEEALAACISQHDRLVDNAVTNSQLNAASADLYQWQHDTRCEGLFRR